VACSAFFAVNSGVSARRTAGRPFKAGDDAGASSPSPRTGYMISFEKSIKQWKPLLEGRTVSSLDGGIFSEGSERTFLEGRTFPSIPCVSGISEMRWCHKGTITVFPLQFCSSPLWDRVTEESVTLPLLPRFLFGNLKEGFLSYAVFQGNFYGRGWSTCSCEERILGGKHGLRVVTLKSEKVFLFKAMPFVLWANAPLGAPAIMSGFKPAPS